ncbi:MAG: hypothetical protein G01um101472_634, partial [Parcubacteria group bacterium Gr01-1014_72]
MSDCISSVEVLYNVLMVYIRGVLILGIVLVILPFAGM